jgi:hypothetical protein
MQRPTDFSNFISAAPSTTLRVVPLPVFTGEDVSRRLLLFGERVKVRG